MSNILDKEVSFYAKITSTKPKSAQKLFDLLTRAGFKDAIMKVREIKRTKGERAYKEAKQNLPTYAVSGLFTGATAGTLKQHSGLICIDIDKKDNPDLTDFDQMKDLIREVPYVAYCGHSVGGDGYFAIIPISNPECHKGHFLSLEKAFARCGIKVDTSCKDVSRKRFISYDDEPYINLGAVTYDRLYDPRAGRMDWVKASAEAEASSRSWESHNAVSAMNNHLKRNKDNTKERERLVKDVLNTITDIELFGIDITGHYEQWFKIGCAFANAFGEEGRQMFHKVSQFGSTYDPEDADRKYNDCLKSNGSIDIGTFFYYAKQAGVEAAKDFKEITA